MEDTYDTTTDQREEEQQKTGKVDFRAKKTTRRGPSNNRRVVHQAGTAMLSVYVPNQRAETKDANGQDWKAERNQPLPMADRKHTRAEQACTER